MDFLGSLQWQGVWDPVALFRQFNGAFPNQMHIPFARNKNILEVKEMRHY